MSKYLAFCDKMARLRQQARAAQLEYDHRTPEFPEDVPDTDVGDMEPDYEAILERRNERWESN